MSKGNCTLYVLLDGECSEAFDVHQGVAQGCSLSPVLFFNGLLKEVAQAGLGVDYWRHVICR